MNAAHATASGVFARRNKSRLKDLIEPAERLLPERNVILETSSQPPSNRRCKLTASWMIETCKNPISGRDLTGGDAGRLSSLDGHDASMVGLRQLLLHARLWSFS